MTAPRRLLAALILACVALPGCGGGSDKDKPEDRRRPAASGPAATRDPQPASGEDVDAVIARIRGATTASSCDPVKGLLHSFYGTISDAACAAVLAEIDGFANPQGEAYGTGMAIDYEAGSAQRVMALVLDADRVYKLDFIADVTKAAVGSDEDPAAATAAQAFVSALKSGDCNALLRNVDRRLGLGAGSDEEVCRRVSDSLLRRELLGNRSAVPKALGGNGEVAFFKLRTAPGRYYTLVVLGRPRGSATRWGVVNALGA